MPLRSQVSGVIVVSLVAPPVHVLPISMVNPSSEPAMPGAGLRLTGTSKDMNINSWNPFS